MELNYLSHHGIKGMKWGVRRFQSKDGSLTPAGRKRYSQDDYHEDYKKVHDKKSVKYMSNQELRDRNNRLQMEQQYQNLTAKKSRAKALVQTYIATAGMITAAAGATAVYTQYAKKGGNLVGKALEKIGSLWAIKI